MEKLVEVCIVAHNEEKHIQDCMISVKNAIDSCPDDVTSHVYIINNGSTDNSETLINNYCALNENFKALHITLGDKANAWNVAVKECVKSRESLIVFVDGDCTVSKESISEMLFAASTNPGSYLLAAIPLRIGRYSDIIIENTMAGRALSGNFYAMTPALNREIASNSFSLPVGLIGDDSLLMWAASHDFSLSNGFVNGRVVGVRKATFGYHRLIPNSLSNIRLYWRRLQRYSLRHLQQCCIKEFLVLEDNFCQLPTHIESLYKYHKLRHIRKDNFLYRFLDRRAAKKISHLETGE